MKQSKKQMGASKKFGCDVTLFTKVYHLNIGRPLLLQPTNDNFSHNPAAQASISFKSYSRYSHHVPTTDLSRRFRADLTSFMETYSISVPDCWCARRSYPNIQPAGSVGRDHPEKQNWRRDCAGSYGHNFPAPTPANF